MERVREIAPDVARSTAITEFIQRPTQWRIERARHRLGSLWDASMDGTLFAQLTANPSTEHVLAVVGDLLAHDHAGALDWATSRLNAESIRDDERREVSLGMADILARHAPATLWTLASNTVASDQEAAKLLLGHLAHESGSGWSSHLEPGQLGELFAWLHRCLPPQPETPPERRGAVSPAMHVSFWRSRILEQLASAGTHAAVEAMSRLEQEFDEYVWIRSMRHRAQEELRRAL